MIAFWRNWIDAGRFALDAQSVVALRMMRLASGGPRVAAETQRMITEKVAALAAAQLAGTLAMVSGKSVGIAAKRAMTPIRRRVRANRRRLSRPHR